MRRALSASFIDRIVGTPEAQIILEPTARPFRNTLMHYNLFGRVDTSSVDLDEPLLGLVPIYFSSYGTAELAACVDRCVRETAETIEEWADL